MLPILQYNNDSLALAGLSIIMMGLIILFFVFIFLIFNYFYFSATLMIVAKKTKTQNPWLAWIPYANLYLKSQVADMHWSPILLLAGGTITYVIYLFSSSYQTLMWFSLLATMFMLLLFTVFNIAWEYKICIKRHRPGWWALVQFVPMAFAPMMFIPIINLIIMIPFYILLVVIGIWSYVMWGILAWSR